ncbi:class I SAM-dependent methyltransferase [Mangrovihabitans endophyticus]|uniref:Trans-aconitate methyltransferase n=1 Tax=Mangrovihabitans endophyticus TaxID=1751298 RepID=A0A8J3C4W1_9ACTN|nr:class I SAM-dependent methyltransferase [Mangrovihabitans endophyticus]GGL07780.1 trans-aconitate methyltransferase [Mangrovihabitans endophyticus]
MAGEFSASWLALREPADTDARSRELLEPLHAGPGPLTVRDLGCGTGSLGRWLAPRLPGPQHWVLHDSDPELLERAAATMPDRAGDGAPVTVQTVRGDVTALTAADLADTGLVACSALLDLLTGPEVEALAAACAATGTPALCTLSVTGEVTFDPADELDDDVASWFNAHQRREAGGRRLLGPDAPRVTAEAFRRAGARVTTRPSPWRLGPDRAELTGQWLRGWVGAAMDQHPQLDLGPYLQRRLDALPAVQVGHVDLLAEFG